MVDYDDFETDEFTTVAHYIKMKRFKKIRKYLRLCNFCYNRHCHDSKRSYHRSWKAYRKTQYRKEIQIRKIEFE